MFRVGADGNSVDLLAEGMPRSVNEIAMIVIAQIIN
jgi:hypothetical protein